MLIINALRSSPDFGIFLALTYVSLLLSGFVATEASAQNKKLNSVGLAVGDLHNPFFAEIARSAQIRARHINDKVKFTAVSCDYDVKRQSDQINDFISSNVNLILLCAVDAQGIAPAVVRAKQAGIAVVAVDARADGGVDATVASNNKQAGAIDAEYIAERLKGKGQIVIVNGPPVATVLDRLDGFLEEIKKHPDVKILSQDQNAGGTRDGGLRVMTNLLKTFKEIDAVFAVNDPTAIGCDMAARQAQRKEFFIVGVDGGPEIVPLLKDRHSLITATAAQDPFVIAKIAVEIGNDIVHGKKPKQEVTLIPVGRLLRTMSIRAL
jgi:ribose transport system substrate-binding protein